MAHVLIADDSMFQRFFLRKIITDSGHEILEAATGRELLDMARARTPELVIMDLNMPEVSGMEVLEAWQAGGAGHKTVVVTADIQHTTNSRCRELGACEVLHKPVDEQTVRGVIDRLLAGM